MTERFGRNPKAETASMSQEAMVFDPESTRFFQLNPTAAFVWNQLAEPSTAEALATEVCSRFEGAASSEVQRDVREILQQMLAHQLIVVLP
jgi:hypothetical protein